MTLGKSPTSEDVFRSGTSFCQDRVPATSIYALLYRESHRRSGWAAPTVAAVLACRPARCARSRRAREALVDALARDAYAVLAALDGRTLVPEVLQAAKLVATVVGQDLEQRDDGMFRIARRVAKDRVISTVDPEARHGHKTAARGFDGYKGHIAVDPDSEIVTATTVTAGNVGDGSVADELVADVLVAPTAPASPNDVPPSQAAPSAPTEPAIVASSGEAQETTPPTQAETSVEIYGDAFVRDGRIRREGRTCGR